MICFFSKKIAISDSEDEKVIQNKLRPKFEIILGKGYFKIIRNRIIGNRGLLRILFPILITKVVVKDNYVNYKTKLDRVGFFIFLMGIGSAILELTVDRSLHPVEYPWFLPVGILIWYLVSITIEVLRIKKLLTNSL
ncbi:MAG: hypothetical protein COA97_03020 [Flavobacteriales bacterium]|nr:MAG: hypothetical protein COA97_03020 [Flavobacteriales bacterium]